MQRRDENGEASRPKRAASIRAESTGPAPPSVKPQGQPASPVRGCTVSRERRQEHRTVLASRANAYQGRRRTTTRVNGRSGIAGEVAPPGTYKRDVAGERCRGHETSREASGRPSTHLAASLARRTTCGARPIGPAEPARPAVPVHRSKLRTTRGRSRAGAPKRTPMTADDAAELTLE